MANLTLVIDDDLLKAARKYALDHDTSVNQMVRDYLAQVVDTAVSRHAAADRLCELMARSRLRVDEARWTRDEINDRELAREEERRGRRS